MTKSTTSLSSLEQLFRQLEPEFSSNLIAVVWRFIAAVQCFFSRSPITPASTDRFERRLERFARELARMIMQRTIRKIESDDRDQTVSSFDFQGQSYRRNRCTTNTIDTRFGSISFDRWG